MAIIQNPIIGRAKRQAGGMVFQTVFEKNIMRSKPFIYRDKKSEQQLLVRQCFLDAFNWTKLMKPFFYYLHFYNANLPTTRSVFHSILSLYRKTIIIDYPDVIFNGNNFNFGADEIDNIMVIAAEYQDADTIAVTWNPDQVRLRGLKSDSIEGWIFSVTNGISFKGTHKSIVADGLLYIDNMSMLPNASKYYIQLFCFDEVDGKVSSGSNCNADFFIWNNA